MVYCVCLVSYVCLYCLVFSVCLVSHAFLVSWSSMSPWSPASCFNLLCLFVLLCAHGRLGMVFLVLLWLSGLLGSLVCFFPTLLCVPMVAYAPLVISLHGSCLPGLLTLPGLLCIPSLLCVSLVSCVSYALNALVSYALFWFISYAYVCIGGLLVSHVWPYACQHDLLWLCMHS